MATSLDARGAAVAPSSSRDESGAALTIREVAAATGVTVHTLRYYERVGLLPQVPRASSGHRRYGPREVRWVVFLRRLHETGMSIRRMLEYARLTQKGDATAAERRALLVAHQAEVEERQRALAENMALIEKKIQMYEVLEQQWRQTEAAAPAPARGGAERGAAGKARGAGRRRGGEGSSL